MGMLHQESTFTRQHTSSNVNHTNNTEFTVNIFNWLTLGRHLLDKKEW